MAIDVILLFGRVVAKELVSKHDIGGIQETHGTVGVATAATVPENCVASRSNREALSSG